MSTWAVVLLVIAINALLYIVVRPLFERWKVNAAARIAERERALDERERTWDEGQARRRQISRAAYEGRDLDPSEGHERRDEKRRPD